MALPFLPGNTFSTNLGKSKYHKSHHFDYNNEVAMNVGETKCGIGGEILPGQKPRYQNSAIPRGQGTDLPSWVAFDKQVLSFDAYFQEAVHEKREEQYRVRHCKIYFYLEDDSIQVIEPRLKNAGIPQGTLIRRHRIPRPAPHDDTFYTVEDFNVGREISLYSRVFKLTNCDDFTSNFLSKLGVKTDIPKDAPLDPYMGHRKALDESMQPHRPYEKHDTLKQFLDHDRHVLRFYCNWDDTDNMFGDPRQMVLHYFLADDTIEIREVIPANAGRDSVPMFLRRGKLPKMVEPLNQPGVETDRTVLNVFGPTGHGGRYILDSLKTGAVNNEFYKDSDLTVGTVLNVWGRRFVLTGCDEFTKEYYRTKYGINDFPTLHTKQIAGASVVPREVPPYNGFGSEEDSLCSCQGLLPKPPKRDFIKFMEKDRRGLDSNVLRFLARLDSAKPIDNDRRFIISYFLSDDTILVFEPPIRNSGVVSGKFIERTRIKKPDQERYGVEMSQYYQAQDLYIGARVEFNKFRFLLIDADEYAYNYMERHASEYPQSNIGQILQKFAEIAPSLPNSAMGQVSFEDFHRMVNDVAPGRLTEHEIRTVARYYQDQKESGISLDGLLGLAQEQLKKANFDNFMKLEEQMVHYDRCCKGALDMDSIRTVCNAVKLPLADDLLRALIAKMPKNEEGLINCAQFVKLLNWRECPVPPPVSNSFNDTNWQGNAPGAQLQRVNLSQILQDMNAGQQQQPC